MDLSLKSLYRTAPEVDYQEIEQSNVRSLVQDEGEDMTMRKEGLHEGAVEGQK